MTRKRGEPVARPFDEHVLAASWIDDPAGQAGRTYAARTGTRGQREHSITL
ncbi:MAG: hypothetical protein OXI81_20840 [Paracoccaceae bacterium]|nr:hypothetical protein [Paracoccaceae bacterium]MDE2914003.1 hypothetical protein [Paracoccaceae bacterium]